MPSKPASIDHGVRPSRPPRLTSGAVALAVVAATIGVAASADAGQPPAPTVSDGVPVPASRDGVSHQLGRADPSSAAQRNHPGHPVDLTPEEVQRSTKEARVARILRVNAARPCRRPGEPVRRGSRLGIPHVTFAR